MRADHVRRSGGSAGNGRHRSFLAASLFELTRQNVLTRDPNPPASNPFARIQTGEVRTRGIELDGKASLPSGLDLRASYTYFDSEVRVPSHTLFDAALHYDLGSLDDRLQGAQFLVNARNLFDKEYVSNCSVYERCYYGDRRTVVATLHYQW